MEKFCQILIAMMLLGLFSFAQAGWADDCKTLGSNEKINCPCDTAKANMQLCDEKIKCCIENFTIELVKELPKKDTTFSDSIERRYNRLVTVGTYNRYFSKDMAKILTIDNAINTGRNFAAVKIDEAKSTFSFSPYNKRFDNKFRSNYNNGNAFSPTLGYLSIFLKGSVNSDGFSEILRNGKLTKDISIGLTAIILLGGGDWYSDIPESCCDNIKKKNFREAQRALPAKICRKYQDIIESIEKNDIDVYSDNFKKIDNCENVRGAMREDFSNLEEKLAEDRWNGKWRTWLSISPQMGVKGFSVLDTILQNKPSDKAPYTGSMTGTINGYLHFKNFPGKPSFYASGSYSLVRRNQFSEASVKNWNRLQILKDSSTLTNESKNVYLFNGGEVNHKFLSTASTQAIGIWTWGQVGIGFDVSFTLDWLYPISGAGKNRKFTESYGIIFPFNDKDGKRTINVSLFYSKCQYTNSSFENIELFGIKFAAPIFSSING